MATFHGKSGSITWAGTGFESKALILSWRLDVTADIADKTEMQATWKTYLAGLKDWTATVETNAADDESVAPLGTAATLTLEMVDAGENLEGNAFCTGISFAVDKDDLGKATHTFQGNGELLYGAS